MKVEFKPSNICANKIIFDLDDGIVRNVVFIGGCDGNHKAIASLCEGRNAEEIANLIPLDKMLIETDSPYLAPEPVRGTRNDSRNVIYMAKKIAEIKQIDIEEVAKVTYQNALNAFNIK